MLRFLTAGESHGPLLTAILEGMPAGLPLAPDDLDGDLARRQQGYGSGGRMQIERDHARITGGVMAGRTTGGPISLQIENRDWKNWAQKDIEPLVTPRPGHADLTGAIKYGYRDLRLALERSSARETAARVAVGIAAGAAGAAPPHGLDRRAIYRHFRQRPGAPHSHWAQRALPDPGQCVPIHRTTRSV